MRSVMLTRYFSALSLLLIGTVGLLLVLTVHRHQVHQMENLAQERNVMMTKVFQNLLLDDVKAIVAVSPKADRAELLARPEVKALQARLTSLIAESDIAKVKIYALNGLTVFSTEASQIGEDKFDNSGFQSAFAGRVISELTHRDEFSAFDGLRGKVDLVSSYLPVYEGDKVVAVFELYQEVTVLLAEINASRQTVAFIVGTALGILFVFQWMVVRRAQRILVAHETQLETDKRQLGERVEERTQALMESQGQVEHLSTHDRLTSLPNRDLLFDRMQQAMSSSRQSGKTQAVLLIDLDHFSSLNDTLGHEKGDRLLCEVASMLRGKVRQGDTLARLGGDEFALLLADLDPHPDRAAEIVQSVGDQLLQLLREHYRLPNEEFLGSGSLGVTLFQGEANSAEDLLKQAELAMYRSKEAGRDRLTFFDPAMAEHLLNRTRLATALRRAVGESELVLHYQPQVDGRSNQVLGAEALVRWQHPERGLIGPVEFIPLAEDTGLILPLGRWVLETACRQLAKWQQDPALSNLVLAVNVSVQQFCQPDFSAQVVEVLQRTGANPSQLKLELTESLFAEDIDAIVRTMSELRTMGIGFSLDDFGTGYSSLAYLSRLPLDQLKIDKAFVQDIGSSDHDVPICTAIISLAHGLNLKVVAEGVETDVQRYFLSTVHHCDQLQGYLISRPLPQDAFEAFARKADSAQ